MRHDSEDSDIMSLREWRQAIRTPTTYRVGNRTLRVQTQFVSMVAIIGIVVLLVLYTYVVNRSPSSSGSSLTSDLTKMRSTSKLLQTMVPIHESYNSTYPLTVPVRTPKGLQYRIGIVSDLDRDSKSKDEDYTWLSYFKKGYLTWNPSSRYLKVTWDAGNPVVLKSMHGEAGRGMELSELTVFNGKLYAFDDRTGIVFEIQGDKVIPFVILTDGDGRMDKGFKSEWAAVRQQRLYVGGLGKEWTSNTGEALNTHPQWVKVVSPAGEIHHVNWYHNYLAVRRVLGIEFPGYITHEAVAWSDIHNKWFFLPRRCSKESYNDVLDEGRGCNVLITTDSDFKDIELVYIGEIVPTHGFSSFKFVPGTSDEIIIALRSEEDKGKTATYVMGFDIHGKILLPETKVADKKYEGLEFL